MRAVPRLWLPALFTVAATGCATTSVEPEMSRLRREVRSLKSELAETKQSIERLENRLTLLGAGRPDQGTAQQAAGEPAVPRVRSNLPRLPVVRIDESARQAPAGEDFELGAVDDGSPPILIKLGPGDAGGEKLPVDREVLQKPDPVLSGNKSDGKAEYELALETLREKKRPAEARALFVQFRSKFPRSPLIANAAYWQAECSLAEAQHQRAIDELGKLIEEHPMSAKVPDALLRIARSWNELARPDQAQIALRRLTRSYPDSEAARDAEKLLAAMDSPGR